MAPQQGLRRSTRAASRATTSAPEPPYDPSSLPSSGPNTTNARVTKSTNRKGRAATAPASGNKTRTRAPRGRGVAARGAPSTRQSRLRNAKKVTADGDDATAIQTSAEWLDEPPVRDIPTHKLDNYKRPPFGESRPLTQRPTLNDMRRANSAPMSKGTITEKVKLGGISKRKPKKGRGKAKSQKPAKQQQETPVTNGETTNNAEATMPAESATTTDPATAAATAELDSLAAEVSAGLPLPGPLSAEKVLWALRKTAEMLPDREALKKDPKYDPVEPKPTEEMTPEDWKDYNKDLRVRYRDKAIRLDIGLVLQKLHEDAGDDPFLLHIAARATKKEMTEEDHKLFRALIVKLYRPVREDQNTIVEEGSRNSAEIEISTEEEENREKAATSALDASNAPPVSHPAQLDATPAVEPDSPVCPHRRAATPPPTAEFLNWRKRKLEQTEPDHSEEAIRAKREKFAETAFSERGKGAVEYPESYVRRAGDQERLAPEEPEGWKVASRCSTPDTVISRLEPEDDAARKPDAHYFPRAEPLYKTSQNADEADNHDYCSICKNGGDLLCCDGCIRSFHFTCLDPPLDRENLPDGDWFCSDCSSGGIFPAAINILESRAARDFQLPGTIRERYKDIRTAANGAFEHWPDDPGTKKERPKNDLGGIYEFEHKKYDDNKILRVCVRCRMSAGKNKPLVLCDYCPSYWHKQCLPMDDPAFYHRPNHINQKRGGTSRRWNPAKAWKCPNHAEHALNDAKKLIGFQHRSLRLPDIPGPVPTGDDAQDFAAGVDAPYGCFIGTEKQMIHNFITTVKAKNAAEEQAKMQAEALARIQAEQIASQNANRASNASQARNNTGDNDGDIVMVDAETSNTLPPPTRSMEDLTPDEREAVSILANMRYQPPPPPAPEPTPRNPAIISVENLLQDNSLDITSSTNELETLKKLQELINERVNTLSRPTGDGNGDGN